MSKPILALILVAVCAAVLFSQSAANVPIVTGNARVDKLLSQMTLEEKIALLHGGTEASPSGVGQAGTWPGLPRLGIPSLRLTDGPPGISINIWSTGMTATMGLAATWSREDARKNGAVIGRDARALGQDVVLEPFVNLVRDFEFSRGYNTFGEDPFLTGQIAVAQVQGTQGEGVMSQAKHFIGYDGGNDVYIDPQTLREIYIAPFVDLANAGVSSIMCSYNKINGLQACDNNEIQNIIFRGEDGFRGFNTSDWGATHGTMNIANGLDMEMPNGSYSAAEPGGRGMMGGGGGRGAAPAGAPGAAPAAGAAPGGAAPAGQTAAAGRGAPGAAALPGGAAQANPGGMMGGRGGGMPEERATGGAGGGRGAGGGPGGRGSDPPAYGMLKAVQDGLIKEQQISLAVGRVLLQMDKFGYLDKAPKHTITEIDSAFDAPVLQKTAEDAATLLKNQDSVLPLSTADLDSTAFIGPTGGILVSIGISGEKAMGLPDHQVGPVPAIEKIAGKKVTYAVANDFDGKPIPASNLSSLVRTNTAGSQTQNDAQIDFTAANGKALPPGTSYTWKGTLTIPSDGTYMLALQTRGTTGSVTLDGNQVVGGGGGRGFGGGFPGGAAGVPTQGAILPGGAAPGAAMPAAPGGGGRGGPPLASLPGLKGQHPISGNITPTADHLNNARNKIDLKAGAHELTVTTTGEPYGYPVQVRLAWVTPQQDKANYDAAIAAAKQAKKAVVFAWARQAPSVFGLPGDQDKLISDVAAVNANTVVVLNTTLPVALPWIDKVKGVLEMWYPGDEGGPATANVLLGKANPAGRLPITWPVKQSDMVAQDRANHPERTNQGIDGKTYETEGIFMGYRWFDKQDIKPLFPFGHGLSYSTFQYSLLKATRAADGGLDVSFTIRNTGKMAGDEAPQVYIGAPKLPSAGAQFAIRQLIQFDRVSIPAGQAKTVALHVDPRRLQYWSTADGRWETATSARTVYVGASSRDVKLQAEVNIAAR